MVNLVSLTALNLSDPDQVLLSNKSEDPHPCQSISEIGFAKQKINLEIFFMYLMSKCLCKMMHIVLNVYLPSNDSTQYSALLRVSKLSSGASYTGKTRKKAVKQETNYAFQTFFPC